MRGTQAALARLERWRLVPDARELSDDALRRTIQKPPAGGAAALLDEFRSAATPSFFPGFAHDAGTSAILLARLPDSASRIVARATAIADGRSTDLGFAGVQYGNPVDWHRDPHAPRSAPRVHWHRVPYLAWQEIGDHKTIWEVNRHQYFVELGQAYALTGDERFARTFASHLDAWIDANPAKVGINWASSLEVSFRAISWLWALHFFRTSPALTPSLYSRALGYLYVHARHIERYLSTYFSPNTHLTGEALGLFMLGCALPRFRAAPRWRDAGWSILEDQSARQIRPDGVYFEQTTWYHRYTTDFYLHALALADTVGHPVPEALRQRCEAAAEHLMYVTRPDGTIPLVGDDDGGRLTRLDDRPPADVRPTLATAAAMFGRADFAAVAGALAHETAWLTGPLGIERFERLHPVAPAVTSRRFSDGGYVVMRDGWTEHANWTLFDCGPHGAAANGYGHAHADALAVEICARGRPLLVDPGTFTYSGPERDAFRSTAAHNTVVVDDVSSSVEGTAFRWSTAARCTLDAWVAHERFDYVSGAHDGYRRFDRPVDHRRAVLFLKRRYWIIVDQVSGGRSLAPDVRWHAAAGTNARLDQGDALLLDAATGASLLRLQVLSSSVAEPAVEQGSVSPVFGRREPAPVVSWRFERADTIDAVSVIVPLDGASDTTVPGRFARAAAAGGTIWTGRGTGFDDVLGVADGGALQGEGIETDCRIVWLRRAAGRILEFVMIDGGTLRVGGDAVVTGPPRGWVSGREESGQWVIESGDSLPD